MISAWEINMRKIGVANLFNHTVDHGRRYPIWVRVMADGGVHYMAENRSFSCANMATHLWMVPEETVVYYLLARDTGWEVPDDLLEEWRAANARYLV